MERPRNEITGDHSITALSQYYPAGFKIFSPKTKYISDRFDLFSTKSATNIQC